MPLRHAGSSTSVSSSSVTNYQYRTASPYFPKLRRTVSTPNVTSIINPFDTSARKYGGSTNVYNEKRRYGQHWDRWDDYVVDRRYDYVNPKYWSYYGREPYRPYSYRTTESNDYYWRSYYPQAIYTPRAVRGDYIATYHHRRYTEPYSSKTHYFYYPYRPWAY